MKQEVYTLLNEMEHSADSYGELRADAEDVRNWKKRFRSKAAEERAGNDMRLLQRASAYWGQQSALWGRRLMPG